MRDYLDAAAFSSRPRISVALAAVAITRPAARAVVALPTVEEVAGLALVWAPTRSIGLRPPASAMPAFAPFPSR